MGDQGSRVHCGDPGGAGEGEVAMAVEGRGQGRAHAGCLEEAILIEADKHGIWVVAIENDNKILLGLAQGSGWVVLEAADANGTDGRGSREELMGLA